MRLCRFTPSSSALVLIAGLLCCQKLAGQGSPASSPPPTVTVFSKEVEVDINVTDAKGNAVHGLTRSDFTVLEDGKPITPHSFQEHSPAEPVNSTAPAGPSLPPNTFTNGGVPASVRPLYILLIEKIITLTKVTARVSNDAQASNPETSEAPF